MVMSCPINYINVICNCDCNFGKNIDLRRSKKKLSIGEPTFKKKKKTMIKIIKIWLNIIVVLNVQSNMSRNWIKKLITKQPALHVLRHCVFRLALVWLIIHCYILSRYIQNYKFFSTKWYELAPNSLFKSNWPVKHSTDKKF